MILSSNEVVNPVLVENLKEETTIEENNDKKGFIFKTDPSINVISKEEFEYRVEKVFELLWKTLSKSFGPYGSSTLIYNYPFSHVTKDGFTIMKNTSMNTSETLLDQSIADMASDICGRLNYTVGDGTTSSIIATNSIYQKYRSMKDDLLDEAILPRDILKRFEVIKEKIINKLVTKVTPIQSDDFNKLADNIRDIAYIASNGDETITEYITDIYRELGCPAISCSLASDGITKKKIIKGYKYNLSLSDRLYINSDNNTMDLTDSDIIIFDKRVTLETYNQILKPLNQACKIRGRHLIVAASMYDGIALNQVIAKDLNNEYKANKDINMVLTQYKSNSANAKKLLGDFAILMNTTVINGSMEGKMIDERRRGVSIDKIFNIDNRGIPGLKRIAINENSAITFIDGDPEDEAKLEALNYEKVTNDENSFDLGFVKSCSLGMNESLFTDELYYNENLYQAAVKDAEENLKELEKKYRKLGTFNIEVSQAQDRLYSLKLKMGSIEIGADSELSKTMIRDQVDDAIKACNSAFNYGVVLGCNVNLIQSIHEVLEESNEPLDIKLLSMLEEGFKDVYRTVLSNAFADKEIKTSNMLRFFTKLSKYRNDNDYKSINDIFTDVEAYNEVKNDIMDYDETLFVHDLIIDYSVLANKVFDLSKMEFSSKVINSVETDEQILKAVIDLMALLITGNQLIVTQKHNFE